MVVQLGGNNDCSDQQWLVVWLCGNALVAINKLLYAGPG